MGNLADLKERMQKPPNLSADIPESLRDADELLTKYGRWAMWRDSRRKCGSAEGNYKAPANDDDRQPREQIMPMLDALDCQRALARVPAVQRVTLQILYIPLHVNGRQVPAEKQCRLLRLPPRLMQERHIPGLRMFANLLKVVHSASPTRSEQ